MEDPDWLPIGGTSPRGKQDPLNLQSHDCMEDPVIAADGQTYERAAIQDWFDDQWSLGRDLTSPSQPNAVLTNRFLVPNDAVRLQIGLRRGEDSSHSAHEAARLMAALGLTSMRERWASTDKKGLDASKLFTVAPASPEHCAVSAEFARTLPRATIDCLERVENGFLHESFQLQATTMEKGMGAAACSSGQMRRLLSRTSSTRRTGTGSCRSWPGLGSGPDGATARTLPGTPGTVTASRASCRAGTSRCSSWRSWWVAGREGRRG